MKVMFRTTVKIVPGKMAEYMEVEKESQAMASRYGMPTWRRYSPLTGDSMHTIVYEMEFDSLNALEASFEKMFADPERQEVMAKSEGTLVSHENELYIPMQ
jgi:antibiotic biosynthesis monooxygenase (ABM) superfamily enzyme